MMSGYLCDNAATKAAFTKDGWYRTGDIGEIRGGKIYIVDRKKELIKVRGWQVAPAELEVSPLLLRVLRMRLLTSELGYSGSV